MPVGEAHHRKSPQALGDWYRAPSHLSSQAQTHAPSQLSGVDIAGLLNRLVDRQHDDMQQAVQREQQARAEAAQREKQLKAEASQREREATAESAKAEAKAEALQLEKQIRNEVEQEARRTAQLR